MKRILSKIALGCMITAGLTACTDWLDVNTDPDNPNNKSLLVSNRLPWIQRMYMYSAGMTNFRTAATAGWLYSNGWSVNTCTTTWNFANGLTTGPYQTWFVESASNLNDLYEKAKEDGAYHYMAAASASWKCSTFTARFRLPTLSVLRLFPSMMTVKPYTMALWRSSTRPLSCLEKHSLPLQHHWQMAMF